VTASALITKLAESGASYRRSFRQYSNGRSALKAILQSQPWPVGRTILLPA
jgi:hypothetical protein